MESAPIQRVSDSVGEFNNDQTQILASAVVTAIPEVVAYQGFQRLFERGLTAGAIK